MGLLLHAEIVQIGSAENAFVLRQNDQELFRIHFPHSIIRRFYQIATGYVLLFQCRSAIVKEKGNVCLVALDGQIIWWAERERSDDCYVEADLEGQSLLGNDGSFNCWINLQTGKVEKREFVK